MVPEEMELGIDAFGDLLGSTVKRSGDRRPANLE
jgi:hypothetical protein